jgi:outer membrane protein
VNLGVAISPDYEGSQNYAPQPMGAARIAYNDFYIETRGASLRANVLPNVLPFRVEFGPAVAYRFGRDDVDNDRVDALRDIDGTVTVGAFSKVYTNGLLQQDDMLGFEIEALIGLGEERDGTTVSFGPTYSFSPWERVRVGFNVSATYASDRYNATYFGIDADNALRSGFSRTDPEGGIKDIGFSINATYLWMERWGVTGTIGLKHLVGAAAVSPIVDEAGSAMQGMAAAGLVYRF